MSNNDARTKADAEILPGVTYTLEDFMGEEDFLDFISGDIGIDVEGVANGFLQNDTVEHLEREGWHKSAISAVQAMARHWLDTTHAAAPERPELGEAVENLLDAIDETTATPTVNELATKVELDAVPQQWVEIRSEDDLPKESGVYWVTTDRGHVVNCRYIKEVMQQEEAFPPNVIAYAVDRKPAPYQKPTVPETVEQFMEREGLGEKEMIDDTLNDRI